MAWPLDEDKWARVRTKMAEEDCDALIVRAPDNVLYLTNYWPMKGYDIAVFPREGDPALLVVEPQLEEARRTAWNKDVRFFRFYHPQDPRPPTARALDLCLEVLRERKLDGRIGVELSQGSQICDRMVGEPTVYTQGYFEAFRPAARQVADATPWLAEVRMLKTGQEIERMRLANELAALGMDYAAKHVQPGMKESEVAAMIEGYIHAVGIGYRGKVDMARAFTLVWSGPGIATFTPTGHRPVQPDQPTLVEIWVCADGYWTDLTKNLCPGNLAPDYVKLLEALLDVFNEAVAYARDGSSLAELDRLIRRGIERAGYPGQPSHPVAHGVGARAHEPPWAHQAGSGTIRKGMVLAIEPGAYWPGGGGLRLEDNFWITDSGNEKLCSYPDDFRA
ncbi:MAG TPA: Xaa-Pro peptidase family protein [Candidatus Acidoferrales bacterium]|nr:Xaa-Pro peptidase family protein [Candidatus Acidoferrales bacterium]